jgi:ribonuclease P protein component
MKGENFDVIVAPGTAEYARLGVIVPLYSQKVVDRNLLKRRIREVMRRRVLPMLAGNADIIVRARKKAYQADYETIKQELVTSSQKFIQTNMGGGGE